LLNEKNLICEINKFDIHFIFYIRVCLFCFF